MSSDLKDTVKLTPMLVQAVQMLNASWTELYELIADMASKNPAVLWTRPERTPEVDVEVLVHGDTIDIALAEIGELEVGSGGDETARRDAGWFVRCVEKRDDTLLRVIEELVSRQEAFLRGRRDTPEPVEVSAVAEALAVHKSTINRAVANKVMRYPGGDLPLSRLVQ